MNFVIVENNVPVFTEQIKTCKTGHSSSDNKDEIYNLIEKYPCLHWVLTFEIIEFALNLPLFHRRSVKTGMI